MKKIIVLLALLLSACNLTPAPGVQPALPTAYIDPSYPTMEAQAVAPVQSSSGIVVQVNRAWRPLAEKATAHREGAANGVEFYL